MVKLTDKQICVRLSNFFKAFERDFGTPIEPAIVTEIVKQSLSDKIKTRIKNSLCDVEDSTLERTYSLLKGKRWEEAVGTSPQEVSSSSKKQTKKENSSVTKKKKRATKKKVSKK